MPAIKHIPCTVPQRRRTRGCRARALCAAAALLCAAGMGQAQMRVMVIGDSNAVGAGVKPQHAWPMRLMRTARAYVQVFGAPGATIAGPFVGLSFAPQCPAQVVGLFGIDWGILALGTNDFSANVPLATVRDGVRALLGSAPSARWICITPPSLAIEASGAVNALGEPPAAYRSAIAEECTAAGAAVIAGDEVVPPTHLGPSGVHLSPRGHARLARTVARIVTAP